ncbi:MAG: ribonuclease HI family protein [Actinomycetota bacterium]
MVSCDGAARGNPGPAGVGVVITSADGKVLDEIGRGIGEATNNVAEYTAVIDGLTRAAELGAGRVLVRSDSRLLVEQVSGNFKVKNEKLRELHEKVRELGRRFESVEFAHVPRELNAAADKLANRGVDSWLAGESG